MSQLKGLGTEVMIHQMKDPHHLIIQLDKFQQVKEERKPRSKIEIVNDAGKERIRTRDQNKGNRNNYFGGIVN